MSPAQLRPMLFIALAFVLFLMWNQWQADYGPKPPPETVTTTPEAPPAPTETPSALPSPAAPPTGEDVPVTPSAVSEGPEEAPSTNGAVASAEQIVTVTTDVARYYIDSAGGTLRGLDLLKYPVATDRPEEPFRLMHDQPPDLFMGQSGLLGDNAPNHKAVMTPERRTYELGDRDNLNVVLTWTAQNGVQVRKIYEFERNKYVFTVRYEVNNTSTEPWQARMYSQFLRTQVVQDGGIGFIYTYTGGVISSEEKPYEKIDFEDMATNNLKRDIRGGWVAMIQHYFGGAWIPDPNVTNHYYSKALADARYLIGTMTPSTTVAPGTTGSISMDAYIGPKIQGRMQVAAPGLERTVDYGWLWLIAHPLFLGLALIESVIGNWGWAIIILTLLIKLAFFHLSATSYKSMARMRKLQPRMVQLRERFGDDRAKMNQAMMELYRDEKINPLSGCLPILVQIPVFISLYWMLLESVELRHAPFMFWLNDLASHDPYFVLPVLMGLSMLIQQRLNPAPPDPMQAKIMMALPFVFTFFFLWFPSGLVLYWVVNNILSIAQQWVITKRIEQSP
ncbi:MAG: membrane protein insertase YidC [Pseudomonadota bacterium]